jgi:hypothetical protein
VRCYITQSIKLLLLPGSRGPPSALPVGVGVGPSSAGLRRFEAQADTPIWAVLPRPPPLLLHELPTDATGLLHGGARRGGGVGAEHAPRRHVRWLHGRRSALRRHGMEPELHHVRRGAKRGVRRRRGRGHPRSRRWRLLLLVLAVHLLVGWAGGRNPRGPRTDLRIPHALLAPAPARLVGQQFSCAVGRDLKKPAPEIE